LCTCVQLFALHRWLSQSQDAQFENTAKFGVSRPIGTTQYTIKMNLV